MSFSLHFIKFALLFSYFFPKEIKNSLAFCVRE